jgi:hypothetical protein
MEAITFKANTALNEKYRITAQADQIIHTRVGYNGPLSGIPSEEVCEKLIKEKSNLVERKDNTPPAKTAATENGGKKN